MLTLDLRGIPLAQVGQPVTLWGPGLPVEQIAAAAGTIPYTLLCRITGPVTLRSGDAWRPAPSSARWRRAGPCA